MLNILIGTWLLLSAFALGMTGFTFWATLLLGIAVVGLEARSFYRRDARWATAGVGVLVLLTAFGAAFSGGSVQTRDLAFWNNFFCGVALVVLSLAFRVPLSRERWIPRPGAPERTYRSHRQHRVRA